MVLLTKNLRRSTVRLWLLEQPHGATTAATAAAGAVASFFSTTTTTTTTATTTKTTTSPPPAQQHPADQPPPEEEERPPSRFTAVFNAMDCRDAMRQYSLCIQKQLELHQNNNDYTAVRPKSCQTEFDAIMVCYRQARRKLLLQQRQQQQQQAVDDDSKLN